MVRHFGMLNVVQKKKEARYWQLTGICGSVDFQEMPFSAAVTLL